MSSRWLGQVGCFGPCTKLSPCKVWSSGRLSLLFSHFHLSSWAGRGFGEGIFLPWLPKSWGEPCDATWKLCWGPKSRSNIITTLVAGIIPIPVSIQGYLSLYQSTGCFMGRWNTWNLCGKEILSLALHIFVWMEKCVGTNMLVHLYINCGISTEFCGHWSIFPMDSWLRVKERNWDFGTQQGKLWGWL